MLVRSSPYKRLDEPAPVKTTSAEPAKPSGKSTAAPPTEGQQNKLKGAAKFMAQVSVGITTASKGIDTLIDTGKTKNCSPEVRAVLKTATKILAVILSPVAVVLSPVVGIGLKGYEAVKTAIKGENHKTDKEIKSVLKDPHRTYPKELTRNNPAGKNGIISNFTSTLVNRGDQETIACDKGRITPQMDIAQHSGDAYGTATISSMMTDSIMTSAAKDPKMSGKIDEFIKSGIASFGNLIACRVTTSFITL